MQALPLIGLSSLRIEGALKANPNPEVLSGQLPRGRLEITSGRRADVEQCLGRSLIQTLPKSLESLPLSLEDLNRFRGREQGSAGPELERGRGRAGEVQVKGGEGTQTLPSLHAPAWPAEQPGMLHCNLFHLIP